MLVNNDLHQVIRHRPEITVNGPCNEPKSFCRFIASSSSFPRLRDILPFLDMRISWSFDSYEASWDCGIPSPVPTLEERENYNFQYLGRISWKFEGQDLSEHFLTILRRSREQIFDNLLKISSTNWDTLSVKIWPGAPRDSATKNYRMIIFLINQSSEEDKDREIR